MARFDSSHGECLVLTYKEGLLSAVAHDLKLRFTRFEVQIEPGPTLRATLDSRSIDVVCAVKDGKDRADLLSDKDKRDIVANCDREVLRSGKYPEIRFESTEVAPVQPLGPWPDYRIKGWLTLCGVRREISFLSTPSRSEAQPGAYVAEIALNQPDFGIAPFSAVFGTLRVKPQIKVRLSLAATI